MSDDPIIEKIKKLLRMKRGGTAGEIENALALAAELARKHGIDLDSVDPDAAPRQPLRHVDATTSARLQWECKYAALVCEQFFNINALLGDTAAASCRRWRDFKIIFIGTQNDIEIALYVYHFLVGHFRRSWNKRANRRLRNRQAFFWGMYQGVCTRLHEQREQVADSENALILIGREVERRKKYVADQFGETHSQSAVPDSDSTSSKIAGYRAGKETEIRGGIKNGTPAPRLQLPPAPTSPAGQLALL